MYLKRKPYAGSRVRALSYEYYDIVDGTMEIIEAPVFGREANGDVKHCVKASRRRPFGVEYIFASRQEKLASFRRDAMFYGSTRVTARNENQEEEANTSNNKKKNNLRLQSFQCTFRHSCR